MDVKSYCDSVGIELNGWKARLYDVMRKTETLSETDKAKVAPMVQDLNAMVDQINTRMAYLARECPADWSGDEAAMEEKMTQLRGKWKEVWGVMGEPEYGIGGA